MKSSLRKQVTLCSVGTLLEWYDFSLFAGLAPIIAKIFFPHADHLMALMSTFVIFASGYIMRPLGAIFFGHLGDTVGRKSTLLITIFLMAMATTAIGIIPLGMTLSTFALVVCRLAQGFACSGEFPGCVTLLAEQSEPHHKGLITSFGTFATGSGIFFGMLMCAITTQWLGTEKMLQWGWRIPFLLGAPLGLFGYFLRKSILESVEFQLIKKMQLAQSAPIIQLIKNHYRILIALLCVYMLANILVYINLLYFGNYALSIHKLDTTHVMYLNLLITFVYSVAILFFGFLSDYVSKNKLMITACLLFAALAYPFFMIILHGNLFWQFFAQSLISLLLGMLIGPLAVIATGCFPTEVRYSGMSIVVNISSSFFGGTAPLVCMELTKLSHDFLTPAFYIILVALLSLIAIIFVIAPQTAFPRFMLKTQLQEFP